MKRFFCRIFIIALTFQAGLFPAISRAYGADPVPVKPNEVKILEGYISSDTIRSVNSSDHKETLPVFYNDSGKLYAIAKIGKPITETRLKHLWFLRDQIILDATVTVKEDQTKAVSGLILKPNWIGKWRVDITDQDGTLLYSIPFLIQKKQDLQQASSKGPLSNQIESSDTLHLSISNPASTP